MTGSTEERRLGFVLSTIHAGSALKLWHKLVERAINSDKKQAFFVFPGGKLDSKNTHEHLRNDIYNLVNSSNVDGVISWASSISGSVSVSELEDFHNQNQFKDIPFVTIGQKVPNHPSVEFDAYTGMKELVTHFIKVHGARKIAFIRAPQNHTSAEERFHGYQDALSDAGISFDENLVTEPLSWYEGKEGAESLCEKRGLVPGQDFTAIVAASDLMAFSAAEYFKKKGVRVPKDLLIGGFNDTSESRISIPSFSTVHMPHAELGVESYKKISDILNGKIGISDSRLPAYPVIRESCGCNHSKIWAASDSKTKIRTQEQFIEEIQKILKLTPEKTEKLTPMITALFNGDKTRFQDLFSQRLIDYYQNDGESLKLFSILSVFRNVICLESDYIEKIIRTVTVLIPRIQERVLIENQYQGDQINTEISALNNELLSVFERTKLIQVLKNHLEKIGISTVAVVLYEDEIYSDYIGGFDSTGEIHTGSIRFSRELLVPESHISEFSSGAFIVQPLFVENRSYGYIICNYSSKKEIVKGIVYEELRSSVSSALQSIFLFEQTNAAKKIAEQAEFAKTEFFANVGSDLCDPLENLSAKVAQMESNIEKGFLDADILSEQLIFLRSQIDSQLEKTKVLVDLTRSQIDDLPMNKKLFDIRQALPGSVAAIIENSKTFPLLFGDFERLKRALQTISDFSEKSPCISEKIDGIHIEFYSSRFDWQKPELLLAEKIILLQFGNVEKSSNYAEIILPWPNLSGLPPEAHDIENIEFFSFSEKITQNLQNFGLEKDSLKHFFETDEQVSSINPSDSDKGFDKKMLFFWEPDSAPIDEWVKIHGLRNNDSIFRSPVICYSRSLIGHDFIEIIEQKIKSQKTASVLFVNAKQTRYGTWATDSNAVSIPSMDEFENILEEITPIIIVFETIDEESIKRVRQNPKTVLVPIFVLPESILSSEDVETLCSHPRIILCNKGAAESDLFDTRVKAILAGDEILPPHTGALVKKAILYLNKNASEQIVRWKLAEEVHVSEDYLTRIFHKEIGLSLWDYLNRYRINLASKMLLETNDTIYEIAEKAGFQDQAYFCRVFKKIYGVPPGKIRTK